jgi:hypothetical protein
MRAKDGNVSPGELGKVAGRDPCDGAWEMWRTTDAVGR